jgi:dipeptidyl aminopeptidase/acylaminoacyl peptidase
MLKNNPHKVKYPISRYLNIRQAYFPSFAADGQHLAFLTNITGIPQVWQVGLPKNLDNVLWPEQLTFESDRVMGVEFSPAPNDDRLIYAHDVGGNENMQLFLLATDGSTEVNLTAGYENAMHLFGEWSTDGQQILFAANRRQPGLFDLYVQALDGEASLVWENNEPGYLFNQTFSPDGQRAAVVRMASSFDDDLLEIELATGTVQQLITTDEAVRYTICHYAADGQSLFVNTDLGSDFLYIARLDLETKALEPLIKPDWDCECLSLSPDGKTLAYTVNIDGAHELYLFDLATGATRPAPRISTAPGIVTDGRLTFSHDSTRLAFSFTSATRTADIFIWDLTDDRIQAVTRSSHGGIPTRSFAVPELIHYPSFDRDERGDIRQIPAWFYRPAGNSNRPMPTVVMVHGGPESQFMSSFHFLVQYFLHNGYAVLAPNVRGSTGYGKAYGHLDDVEKRLDSVADLAHAAYWLRDQPDIDGKRLVVYGGSYGGFMVLSALTTYPDLWAAGVDIVGISNFVTFLENTSEYRRSHREAEYGSLEHDRDFLETISPSHQLDKITAPLMVIHGANDPRVPLSEAEQVAEALKTREIPVEFLVFDDEGHGLVKLKNKLVAYPAIIEFLDKHLAS